MKCPKCGNVSFDHLDNCMKCSRDLSADRNELNLLDFRPEVPFLLGSLVGEMQGGGVQQDLSFTQETEIELGGLNMGEPPATEGSIDMPGAGSSEELSLSEIAMDDLETIEASALGDAAVEELELGDLAELSGEEADQAEEDDGFLGLEFEEDEPAADDVADGNVGFVAAGGDHACRQLGEARAQSDDRQPDDARAHAQQRGDLDRKRSDPCASGRRRDQAVDRQRIDRGARNREAEVHLRRTRRTAESQSSRSLYQY